MLLSKEMIADNNDRQVELISNRLTDNPYKLLDEFYVVHKYKDTDTVESKGSAISRYRLLYPSVAPEMYFAYFVPEKSDNKYMVSLVYAKFDYGWKITQMGLSPYTINGKTAPELYALARDQFEKKEYQAALNNSSLAQTCFSPGLYWQYPDEPDAFKFYIKAKLKVNQSYRFPLVMKQVPTGPMILNIYMQKNDDGTFPVIYYMTHFPLKDIDDVKKENLQVQDAVKKIMPGITDNNKFILYSAFNEQPDGYKTVDHYDVTAKTH